MKKILILLVCFTAQVIAQKGADAFKQIDELLPNNTIERTTGGKPGKGYWQQKADYKMQIVLNDEKQQINGQEKITYYNNSPDDLEYLWLQLDQNVRAQGSLSKRTRTGKIRDNYEITRFQKEYHDSFEGGFNVEKVIVDGKKGTYTINETMLRIDLEKPLKSGDKICLDIDWWYNINDGGKFGGRSGYEYFPEEDNYMYHIAQFFPRMCVYSDTYGWQNKQFLGRGEFTLTFGDYDVDITVPADHIVGATGELENMKDVLTKEQIDRFKKAQQSDEPIMIVTEAEAEENEKEKETSTKTWNFKAKNVRDFAFCSSRKFIWDGQGVSFGDRTVMAMSYYPKEGNPLWEKYSTRAIVHTLNVYSKYTFDYPYPTAISTHANFTGMEYPMICFNFGRPRPDGSYSERLKYGMIGVIIHEIGHNYFPMIVNSDERQWTWMDEGLNTFLQYLTQCEWERDYPHRRGPAENIVDYMKGDKRYIVPIMTNSESIYQFGNNAYGKPATALNILRETIMGRELFDHAFKTYSNRWKFKHPTPADFFRTMEDASGVDLDWFWRGWFYGINHVDIAISNVDEYQINTQNADIELVRKKINLDERGSNKYDIMNNDQKLVEQTFMEQLPQLRDKYNDRDPLRETKKESDKRVKIRNDYNEVDIAFVEKGYRYYEMTFENIGGLVMPIIVEMTFADGEKEVIYVPVEVWRYNSDKITKVFVSEKEVVQFKLDPYRETADVDPINNYYPRKLLPNTFDVYRSKQGNQ